jgi:hypothetical protein
MTTAILSDAAPRATKVSRIWPVGVMTRSANRMLACSTRAIARTAGCVRSTPNLVAKNSGMHSCRSSSTRAPSSRGTAAANTSASGNELTWTSR